MKRGKRESGFSDVVALVAAVCATLMIFGLLVPPFRPLAFQLGTAVSLAFVAGGISVAIYAVWRVVTFSSRRRKAAALARART